MCTPLWVISRPGRRGQVDLVATVVDSTRIEVDREVTC
jgi:hypothetical protein